MKRPMKETVNVDEFIADYKGGMSYMEMARKYDYSYSSIIRFVDKLINNGVIEHIQRRVDNQVYNVYNKNDDLVFNGTAGECADFIGCVTQKISQSHNDLRYIKAHDQMYLTIRSVDMIEYEKHRSMMR